MDITQAVRSAYRQYHAGNMQQSRQICIHALKEDPENEEILYILGLVCAHLEDYEGAIQHLKKALDVNVPKADMYLALGAVYQKKLLFDDAVGFYRKALEVDPDFAEAYENMGDIFRETHRLDEAIASYKKVLHYYHDAAEVHYSLGGIFKERGQVDLAVFYFRNAIRYKPDYAEAYAGLGMIFHEQRRLDDAIGCYEKALAHKPALADVSMNLEGAFQEKRERARAIRHWQDWTGVTIDLRFINIEMMINAIINQFYFRHLHVQFHPDILQDADYKCGPKRKILEDLLSASSVVEKRKVFFCDLERLGEIRQYFADRHTAGITVRQKKSGAQDGENAYTMKTIRRLHREFMSKADRIEAQLVKIFHS